MKPILLLPVFLSMCLLTWSGCQSSGPSPEDGMARFAADSGFREAHALPDTTRVRARGVMREFPCAESPAGRAYVTHPTEGGPVLLAIHEWWGLNDQIRTEADALADSLNLEVWALDLYDGEVATDRETAGQLMQSRDPDRLGIIIRGALKQLSDREIGTIGWCFGGGWSLRTAIQAGAQARACVIYYGMPVERADELAPLRADILGLFASRDTWINDEVVHKFDALCKATGKSFTHRSFNADHAFANPSNPHFDNEAAREANALALAFLHERLR